MISSLKMVIPLLFLVILGCEGVGRDIENFLRNQGLENLTQTFVSEIRVRHMNRLTDQNLMGTNDFETSICCDSLGLTTGDLFVSSQKIVMSNPFVYLKPPN